MFKHWRKAAAGLVAALALVDPAAAAPAMWLVRDADTEIYLFGTMHLLTPGSAWRTPAYDQAYARAGAVWFEAETEGRPGEVDQLLARYGVDTERRLSDRLTRAEMRALKPALRRGKLPLERIDNLRPWAAAITLEVLPLIRVGHTVETGADVAVTRQAHAAAKPVRNFETLEQQIRMFAGLPEAVELQYLTDVLGVGDGLPEIKAHDLEAAWLAGDLTVLSAGLVGAMKAQRPTFYAAFLADRNRAWADKLAKEMAGSGVSLVNVGALHMVGDDGLPALLEARGFEVVRVQ